MTRKGLLFRFRSAWSGASTGRQGTHTRLIVVLLSVATLLLAAPLLIRANSSTIATLPVDICVMAAPQAYDPASGLPLLAARTIPKDARCPVCGMYPARTPQWAAQLIFSNGDAHFFDSPLSLYLYLNAVTRYSPGRNASEVATTYVTDTESGHWTPARQAFYVQGSTALGPMRNGNLPAFASETAAQRFTQQRGGKVLTAGKISPALLDALNTRSTHTQHALIRKHLGLTGTG
ncbi:MAG: hypothetical protein GZ093_03620 [Rhodoferax sp.]|uniref:nitrous oxide reductase accessory protein NosL n=1 Tax=Rhodoferax sp. TaxID=50421 RepID=UPI001401902F|nr:nitrous oxide reductase accessory protein NosL [Rhodoferax sp.]NDP37826.1 hypothetical protein [Rhodoferax sp.]